MSRWLVLGPIPVFEKRQGEIDRKAQKAAFDNDKLTSFENFEPSVLIGQVPYQWKVFQSDNEIMDLSSFLETTRTQDLLRLGSSLYGPRKKGAFGNRLR